VEIENQSEAARLNYEAAQANLQDLLDGPDPDAVSIEEGRIWLASAQAQAAQARLDFLNAQPFPEAVAIAEANVEQAQADLEAAQARLSQATIVAPFGGTVTQVFVDASEFIGAAQPVVQMGDLTGLRVETTDLNEVDVARVAVGDSAVVTLDALPSVSIDGQVTRIAPKASEGSGVNYTVIIELSDIPEAVRWGMTAFVEIEVE
jgi:multidrug resistance efflux pump